MTLRPDEDYVDRFELRWALVTGAIAFFPPWLVVLTYNGDDSRFVRGERLVWSLWIVGLMLGLACVLGGRRARHVGRIGVAIIVGDVLGALLFFISLAALLIVGYAFFYGGEG
jgi:hypothetical protein